MNKLKKSDFFQKIDLGVRRGVARALANHKKAGRSIVIWQNDRVVRIPAEDIVVDYSLLDNFKEKD